MTDRPIIMSAPTVVAILREIEAEGTGKTMTRDELRYQRDGDRMRAKAKRHYHQNRDRILERRKELRTPEHRARDAKAMRRYHAALRAEMIAAYGAKCKCCGEKEPLFFELDHVNGRGNEHRRTIGRGSHAIYRHLKKSGWPEDDYQLLCANCNAGKARNGGVCPHGR